MLSTSVFVAYPSEPENIGITIEDAAQATTDPSLNIVTWPSLDIPGRFIVERIFEKIDAMDFVVADITRLNFNVTFEIGYALGRQKRIVLVLNKSLQPATKEITELGIFDTLGYKAYENSAELTQIISSIQDFSPIHFPAYNVDLGAPPLYIVDTLHKTDASVRIISKIKKAGMHFRSFDPKEQPRMSTLEAYGSVSKSVAVVIHLLSSEQTDYRFNNLRGAFVAGLSYGFKKETLILQEAYNPVPLDYRDFVSIYKYPQDVDQHISTLAPIVMETLQKLSGHEVKTIEGFLQNLDLGHPAAENEVSKLSRYYMQTDEYKQVLKEGARLAVGRKGSGKTALFFQVRDKLLRSKKSLVLDLKPQGHQLKRFKHVVLKSLSEPIQEHVATAFWEYVLYLELCYKILQTDREVRMHNHELYEPYQRIADHYRDDMFIGEADFSERMLMLVNRISDKFMELFGSESEQYLPVPKVTEFVYQHNIPELRKEVVQYLDNKDKTVILFDNIDKGWPTKGIEDTDILLLRGLLDATRKLERDFQKKGIEFHVTIFLRSDVCELLTDQTPDRGKESRVSLDWTDPDLLREFLRKRLVYNGIAASSNFDEAWHQMSVPYVNGQKSAEYLIERSLMRPRNFLALVNHCKSNAVNLQHSKILEQDILKACDTYSADIAREIGLEIRDVFPLAEDIVYCFIGAPAHVTLRQVKEYLKEFDFPADEFDRIIEILMWFSFFGVLTDGGREHDETYIYDVHYDIKKLKHLGGDLKNEEIKLTIHKAFWPFLEVEPSGGG